MSYNFEALLRSDGKILLTVTCPSCQEKTSLVINVSEDIFSHDEDELPQNEDDPITSV